VIFGTRNFAALAHYYFEHDSEYSVHAFAVDKEYVRESSLEGLPVVAAEELPTRFPPDQYDVFVAIGIAQINRLRAEKLAVIESLGYTAASFVSSKAAVADNVAIRPNTIIMDNALVQPAVHVGKGCAIFPGTLIGFRSHLGDHCWLVDATVGESVRLGSRCFVGVGAIVGPNVMLGESCIVGAGALVLDDGDDFSLFRGAKSERRIAPPRMRRTFGVGRRKP
jgi:sugar O-acyltransferase (sialic acid O-acetyltransferase NeuD family)